VGHRTDPARDREPADLAADAARYMHALQWALAPALLYFSTRCAFAALDRVAPTLIAGLIAVVFNAARITSSSSASSACRRWASSVRAWRRACRRP